MPRSITNVGQSILLASILALLSYIPFEHIAKSTLIFCAISFIADPFPPYSRIVSLAGVLVVFVLGKINNKWIVGQELEAYSGNVGNKREAKETDRGKKDQ